MKIDKIVFSSTDKFSMHWNYQSEVWHRMGIEPVLLLWGEKTPSMTDKYGEIIEMKYSNDAVKSLQMTWSKFQHTSTEPSKTWMTGDMDMYPLQTDWFIDKIKDVPDDYYAHLAASHLCISNGSQKQWWTHGGQVAGGNDLVAPYHVAKGETFIKVYDLDKMDLIERVKYIAGTGKYGWNIPDECKGMDPIEIAHVVDDIVKNKKCVPPHYWTTEPFWCADENYTSDVLWQKFKQGDVKFYAQCWPYVFDFRNPKNSMRIDRYFWDGKHYSNTDVVRLKMRQYIDIHCHRDFYDQKDDLERILKISGMIGS